MTLNKSRAMQGNMKNRRIPSADLLACFPSRAHLKLLPKPVCSPSRTSEPNNRNPHHRRKRSTGGSLFTASRHAGQLSPVPWPKTNKQIKSRDDPGGGPESSEPTSPKVTCAGQIKARPNRNWQSVMEEIERIHKKQRRKPTWGESLGFKKDAMQFLTCLRSIRFDFNFRCFGSFPAQAVSSDEEEEEEEEDEKEEATRDSGEYYETEEDSNTVFSKWYMVLQEDQQSGLKGIQLDDEQRSPKEASVPPPNALLLMRCRSAPVQSRLKRRETEDEDLQVLNEEEEEDKSTHETPIDENRRKKKRESLEMVMKYDTDFNKLSSDDEIAKETWVDNGFIDLLSRSRSCKR